MTDDDVDRLLARRDVWDDPPPGLEDAVVAAIGALAAEATTGPVAGANPAAAPRSSARPRRRLVLAAIAAAVLVLGALGVVLVATGGDDGGVVVALSGTELAPGASATADVEATPLGVKIVLDVEGLAGAPEGSYYEAWLRSAEDGVSAGTFHLRGGDGAIELWCGVDDPAYTTLTVTLQDEGDGNESSGRVVLRGELDPAAWD